MSTGLDRASQIRCESVQIFAKNNKCWTEGPIRPDEIERFRERAGQFERSRLVSHAGYLINLSAGDPEIHKRSVKSMHEELCRAESLGLAWVVLHPGSHGGRGEDWGLRRVIASLQSLLNRTRRFHVGILLETTAGQGNALGWRFEHLKFIRRNLKPAQRVGVCVDTCHIFAAGYDIRSRGVYTRTMAALESTVGLRNVKLFHLNDSVKGLGSRVDRHQHIGQGEIGIEGFRLLMNDARFADYPMVLETPKGPDMKEDVQNLALLRGLKVKRRG